MKNELKHLSSQVLFEREAELSYSKQEGIEEAAHWCIENYPHKLEFLNSLRLLLTAEQRSLTRFGFETAVRAKSIKLLTTLEVLTPSQALRLLSCHKRFLLNDKEAWRMKNPQGSYGGVAIHELEKIERIRQREKIQERALLKMREQKKDKKV